MRVFAVVRLAKNYLKMEQWSSKKKFQDDNSYLDERFIGIHTTESLMDGEYYDTNYDVPATSGGFMQYRGGRFNIVYTPEQAKAHNMFVALKTSLKKS